LLDRRSTTGCRSSLRPQTPQISGTSLSMI
jgi:hypothetical protein